VDAHAHAPGRAPGGDASERICTPSSSSDSAATSRPERSTTVSRCWVEAKLPVASTMTSAVEIASRFPSGLQAMSSTMPRCRTRNASSPVSTSQIRSDEPGMEVSLGSRTAAATVRPSGLTSSALTEAPVAVGASRKWPFGRGSPAGAAAGGPSVRTLVKDSASRTARPPAARGDNGRRACAPRTSPRTSRPEGSPARQCRLCSPADDGRPVLDVTRQHLGSIRRERGADDTGAGVLRRQREQLAPADLVHATDPRRAVVAGGDDAARVGARTRRRGGGSPCR
jgi:hypothetical protein